jgi:hypothetical protein
MIDIVLMSELCARRGFSVFRDPTIGPPLNTKFIVDPSTLPAHRFHSSIHGSVQGAVYFLGFFDWFLFDFLFTYLSSPAPAS